MLIAPLGQFPICKKSSFGAEFRVKKWGASMEKAEKNSETSIIEAAGGLVWRDSPSGKRVAVIRRSRYGGDYTLPKGKLKPGEDWQDAALREVFEETGCNVCLGSFAGVNSYTVQGKPKLVLFWNMTVTGESDFKPSEEVEEILWLPAEEAEKKLDYPGERVLLRPKELLPVRRARKRFWKWVSYGRLSASLPAFRAELECLIQQCKEKTGSTSPWVDAARNLLNQATAAVEKGDEETGWRCFLASQRMELFGLDEWNKEALKVKGGAILCEGKEKLTSWRKRAVEDLLAEENAGESKNDRHRFSEEKAAKVFNVFEASLILHGHYSNVHQKLRTLREQFTNLAIVAGLAAALWAVVVLPMFGIQGNLGEGRLIPSVILFGVMGAAMSGILSLSRDSTKARIPDLLVRGWIIVVRPVVGALSALAVYLFLISGILQLGQLSPGLILAFSFAAGFSERLVVRTMSKFTPEKERTEGS